MTDVLALDPRLLLAVLAIIIAGIAKGVTGMGLPVAGVPILVALYGDLRLVLLVTILATAATDIPMVWRYRSEVRALRMLIGFLVFGLIGIIIGTRILVYVKTAILSGVLAVVVIAFIAVSWLGRVPTMSRLTAARVGPLVGLVCGVLQGSAGAAGPITTSYLISSGLSRGGFLFAINAIFFVMDWTQFVALHRIQTTTAALWMVSVVILVLTCVGMWIGLVIQDRIDDRLFRRGVLIMLGCAAIALIARAVHG